MIREIEEVITILQMVAFFININHALMAIITIALVTGFNHIVVIVIESMYLIDIIIIHFPE